MYIDIECAHAQNEVVVNLGEANPEGTVVSKVVYEAYAGNQGTHYNVELIVFIPFSYDDEDDAEDDEANEDEDEEEADGEDAETTQYTVPPHFAQQPGNPGSYSQGTQSGWHGFGNNWVRSYTEF